ncbi:hypothetical protein V8C35DRAFT_326852 [Trichoderma chlorosporum]
MLLESTASNRKVHQNLPSTHSTALAYHTGATFVKHTNPCSLGALFDEKSAAEKCTRCECDNPKAQRRDQKSSLIVAENTPTENASNVLRIPSLENLQFTTYPEQLPLAIGYGIIPHSTVIDVRFFRGLSTVKEKVEAIRNLDMPTNLCQLESGLGLMGYYRNFVEGYSHIAEPLQKIKAIGFRRAPPMHPQRTTYATQAALPLLLKPEKKGSPDDQERENKRVAKINETRHQLWEEAKIAWETCR